LVNYLLRHRQELALWAQISMKRRLTRCPTFS
jgi:hypothetical protein